LEKVFAVATVSLSLLAASDFDQDSPHGLGRGSKKVSAIFPVWLGAIAEQSQVGFMH
jgi:hypothetical protein